LLSNYFYVHVKTGHKTEDSRDEIHETQSRMKFIRP